MVATRILKITDSPTNLINDSRLGMNLPINSSWRVQNTGNSKIFFITTEETTYTVGTHDNVPFVNPGDSIWYDVASNEYVHLWTRPGRSSSISIDYAGAATTT